MPIQSSYDQFISEELASLMNRSRRIQQMLFVLGGIDPEIMLDFQTAVDDIRECAAQINRWLAAQPGERDEVITQSASLRTSRVERGMRGLLADGRSISS